MSQQLFWNEKFSREGYLYGKNPNEFIKETYTKFNKNEKVLCLGEGEGRNAIFLAKQGFDVEAIDASNIGIEKLKSHAEEQSVNIKTSCMDLNDWQTDEKYGAVLFTFLHLEKDELNNLLTKIEACLEEGGYFTAEVFSKNQFDKTSGGPKNLDLLYEENDFKEAIKNLKIHKLQEETVYLNEGKGHQGEAHVIRIIAQKL